ncbi:MAG: tyrosine-type recombinase/integrase [Paracoccaceae bacterium]
MASIYRVDKKGGTAWRVQIRKADGTSASRTFPTRREAKQWASYTEQEISKGRRIAANGTATVRFGDLLDTYTAAHENQMGRSKKAGLALLRRRVGKVKLSDLALGRTLLDFVANREKDGAGPATILQDLSYLRTVLEGGGTLLGLDVSQQLAVLSGTRRMLANAGRVSKPQERNRRPTEGELVRLIEYWDANSRQTIPMPRLVRFACCSAMRLSEITGLRWDGLNDEARTVLIRDRKHPRQKKGNNQTVPLLRGPFRLGGDLVDPLAEVLAQPRRGNLVFPYNPNSVSAAFTRACKKIGIEDLHFHDLRHHGVSLFFEAGLAIEQVALVSGHRDWSMLRRYTNLKGEDLHRVLESMMGGGNGNVVPLHGRSGGTR